jgi:Fur family ferric uptake transcriptional regulator
VPVDVHREAESRLMSVDQRYTANRRGVVDVLVASGRPLTAAEVLTGGEDFALSSLYRSLAVLEEAGIVRRLLGADTQVRYELDEALTGDHHHHLVCRECGRVEDVPATHRLERAMESALAEVSATAGFQPEHHRLDVVGISARCLQR